MNGTPSSPPSPPMGEKVVPIGSGLRGIANRPWLRFTLKRGFALSLNVPKDSGRTKIERESLAAFNLWVPALADSWSMHTTWK